MSTANARVFSRLVDEQSAEAIEVAPKAGITVYIRIQHPQGGLRVISICNGPTGGIDMSCGVV